MDDNYLFDMMDAELSDPDRLADEESYRQQGSRMIVGILRSKPYAETDKALCYDFSVRLPGQEEYLITQCWLPKSQCLFTAHQVMLPAWLWQRILQGALRAADGARYYLTPAMAGFINDEPGKIGSTQHEKMYLNDAVIEDMIEQGFPWQTFLLDQAAKAASAAGWSAISQPLSTALAALEGGYFGQDKVDPFFDAIAEIQRAQS